MTKYAIILGDGSVIVGNYTSKAAAEKNAARLQKKLGRVLSVNPYEAESRNRVRVIRR